MLYDLCGEHAESLHHLLLFCPYSRSVWNESPWQLNIVAFGTGSVEDWIRSILHPHQSIGIPMEDQHLFQFFAANAIDLVWAARNQIAHGGKRLTMGETARRVRLLSWEHWHAWRKKIQPSLVHVWQPPPNAKLKINVEVAVRDCFAIIAAIARDFQGTVLGAVVKQIEALEPVVGDAYAAKLGMELAEEKGFRVVLLEGDFELVIKAIQAWPQSSEWGIHPTVFESHDIGQRFLSWQADHVYRGANVLMHYLARWAAIKFSLVDNLRCSELSLDLS